MTRYQDCCRVLSVLLLLPSLVSGDPRSLEDRTAFEWLGDFNPNRSHFFQQTGLHMGGWLNGGLTFNAQASANAYNDTVTFADRANEPQLNQFYWFIERDPQPEPDAWQLGGRLDFVLGSDAFFTRSMGDPAHHWDAHLMHEHIYGVAFPQAYLDIHLPLGSGLRMRLGEFYTLIGNESVMSAPDNFFYSHAYLMQYAEPFSHTGYWLNYSVSERLELATAAVTGSPFAGWDGSFEHRLENWGLLGSAALSWPEQGSRLTVAGIQGGSSDQRGQDINLYSVTLKQVLATRWQLTVEHDYGWSTATAGKAGSEWYGIAGYLKYEFDPGLALGLRLEWFRDDDGVRVGVPARHPDTVGHASDYFETTLGLNWRPLPWMILRPSVRYDYSADWQAFSNNTRNDQVLLMSDVIIYF